MALFVSPFNFIESSRNTVTMFDILENFGILRHSAPLAEAIVVTVSRAEMVTGGGDWQ